MKEMLRKLRRNHKRLVAFMLTIAMTCTNVITNLNVAFAAEEPASALFLLDSGELRDAIQEAKEGGEAFDYSSLELSAKSTSLSNTYKKLLGGTDGTVYELDVEINDDYAPEGTALNVFYNEKTEDVTFLFINDSDETIVFRANVSGYETSKITVTPNNVAAADDAEVKDDTIAAPDQPAPGGGGSSGSGGSSSGTDNNVQEENKDDNPIIDEDPAVPDAPEDADEADDDDENAAGGEVAGEDGESDQENDDTDVTDEGDNDSADSNDGTSDKEASDAGSSDEEASDNTDAGSSDSSSSDNGSADGGSSDSDSSDSSSSDSESGDNSSSDSGSADSGSSDGDSSDSGEAVALSKNHVYRVATGNDEEELFDDVTVATGANAEEDNEDVIKSDDEQFLEDDTIYVYGSLKGKSFNEVTIWETAHARAYRVSLEDLNGTIVEGYNVDYSVDPVGAATIHGKTVVAEGEDLYFSVEPQVGYELVSVTANGEVLEAIDAADVASKSDLASASNTNHDAYLYVVNDADADLEIVASLEETSGHPEFNEEYLASDGVLIRLHADEGIIPEGTVLDVTEVTVDLEGVIKEKVENDDELSVKTVNTVLAYDINLMLDGKKLNNNWSKNGYVEVTFSGATIEENTKAADSVEIFVADDIEAEPLNAETVSEVTQDTLTLDVISEEDVTDITTRSVSFEAEHFSIYTIVFGSGNSRKSVKLHYVDQGGKEINGILENSATVKQNVWVSLAEYANAIEKYTYLNTRLSSADEKEGILATEIKYTGSGTYKWKYKTSNNREQSLNELTDIYLIYQAGDLVPTIEDKIKEEGTLNAVLPFNDASSAKITYKWFRSTDATTRWEEIPRVKVSDELYNISADGKSINVSLEAARNKQSKTKYYYKVQVTINDAPPIESAATYVPFYDELQNGSFEEPVVTKWSTQVKNGEYEELVWLTTGKGTGDHLNHDIEIARPSLNMGQAQSQYHCDKAADGMQFAELNCEAYGSLYQDVLTVPGTTLNWGLYHRGRSSSRDADRMRVIIMPTENAQDITTQEQVEDIIAYADRYGATVYDEMSATNKAWKNHTGTYTVPQGQYLTRFFFVATYANGGKSQGNFIDKVQFGYDVPEPSLDKGNLLVTKIIDGVEKDSDLDAYSLKITLQGPSPKTYTFTKQKFEYIGGNRYSASHIFEEMTPGEYVVIEESKEIAGYRKVNSTVQVGTGEAEVGTKTSIQIEERKSGSVKFTNSYLSMQTGVSGSKTWNDGNDIQSRPSYISILLYATYNDGTGLRYIDQNGNSSVQKAVYESKTVSAADLWRWNWSDLPKYYRDDTTKPITYSIDEIVSPNYMKSIDGFNITNTLLTDISGSKTWLDYSNATGTRPESLTLTLYGNEEVVEATPTWTKDGNVWRYSYTGLKKYDAEGNTIIYRVEESVPEGYTKEQDGNDFTNTLTDTEVTQTNVSGSKTWLDYSNAAGTRPESLVLTLYGNEEVVEATPTWTKDGNVWRYSYTGLKKYDAEGNTITYRVEESEPEGYTKDQVGNDFTNTLTDTEATQTNVSGSKTWLDYSNAAGTRPESLTLTLYGNEEVVETTPTWTKDGNVWRYSYTGLKKYDAEGNTIIYRVEESEPEGYTKEQDGNDFTNTLTDTEATQTNVSGSKTWLDYSNAAGTRPESLVLTLYGNEEVVEATPTWTKDGNVWRYSYTGLKKYDAEGNTITYRVEESEPEGYTKDQVGNDFTNTLIDTEVTLIQVIGKKIWVDDSNAGNVRPDSVSIILTGNGELIETTPNWTKEGDEWTYHFENLKKYDEFGEEITYTVDEELGENDPYVKDVNGTTITNTLRTGTFTAGVTKDLQGRPLAAEQFTFELYAVGNSEAIATAKNAADGSVEFKDIDLPVYTGPANYFYEIKEVNDGQPGYEYSDKVVTVKVTVSVNETDPTKLNAAVDYAEGSYSDGSNGLV